MKWFYNLRTSVKLISAFVLMATVLGFVGFFGLNNMSKINTELDFMYKERVIPIDYISSSQVLYQQMRVNIRDMNFTADTPGKKAELEQSIDELRKEVDKEIDNYKSTYVIKEEQELLDRFEPAWHEYNQLMDQAIQYAHDDNDEAYNRLAPEFRETGDEVEGVLQELIDYNSELAKKSSEDANALFKSSQTITIIVIIVSLILSIGMGYFIAQVISRPLNRVVGVVGKVSSGDLTETMEIDTKDEIGQLAKSVDNMVLSLRTTVGEILGSAENVSAAAQEISASTEEIANGSTSQANEAQVMNELFRELSTAINSVAATAEQTSELTNETMGIAKHGGNVISSSIESMNLVNEQMSLLEKDSNKIGEIISVIDDISSQTNLLALNATIEAARAGEQGRGFAVVADEVRKLAERSGEATKEITDIINGMQQNTQQSVKAVAEGVVTSVQTGEAFENILNMVNQSAARVTEIAAASEEQAAQTAEVLNSIESISAATEEAAAGSEQTASTAQSLANLAEGLNQSVAIFKLK
ncbi:methyl-accepting chemotaxis protein [Domibacillus epiphyticus]|uniref:Methyl-accepting chemotaxis protein n=1 Tax=Domibacillus epiphyticus TaxID=1714355 RepID=A0A1V2A7L8_9BACI|nr:methyl-accepting chemotaxis protein [Domibacillus epiphyticus]OMP67003.1 methyl-accepting chemotaxis protein [Domibacillus epiphyticus]